MSDSETNLDWSWKIDPTKPRSFYLRCGNIFPPGYKIMAKDFQTAAFVGMKRVLGPLMRRAMEGDTARVEAETVGLVPKELILVSEAGFQNQEDYIRGIEKLYPTISISALDEISAAYRKAHSEKDHFFKFKDVEKLVIKDVSRSLGADERSMPTDEGDEFGSCDDEF